MCDPLTAVGLTMSGAGAATGAVGAYYGAKGEKLALRSQADLADINAQLSELSAKVEIKRGQDQEQNSRLKTAGNKATQRVNLAANGIDLSSDTAINIQDTTDLIGEVEANTIQADAIRAAWGYRTEAVNYKTDANFKRTSARSINPSQAAFTSLLNSAGPLALNASAASKASSGTTTGQYKGK